MATLQEVEKAAATLSNEEKRELIFSLATSLRKSGKLPPPRTFTKEQMLAWVKEDEEDLQRILDGQ